MVGIHLSGLIEQGQAQGHCPYNEFDLNRIAIWSRQHPGKTALSKLAMLASRL